MPNVFGKESKKKELVNNLGEIYQKIEREHQISPGDFPNLRKMQVQPPLVPWERAGGDRNADGSGHREGDSGGNPGSTGWGLPKWKQHPTQSEADPGEVDPGRDTSQGNVVTHPEG